MDDSARFRRRGSVASLSTAALVEDIQDRFARLPRNTLSAKPSHRASRGVEAILVSFDRKVQAALWQLCLERIELLARRAAVVQRLDATPQRLAREPDVLERLELQLRDNASDVRRLARGAAPVLLDAVMDPALQDAVAPMEEELQDDTDARVFRRRLESRRVTRVDAPYRHASHESPNVRGARDLHNDLNARDPEEGLSYYQKQQLRYGRARRGSTGVAGMNPLDACDGDRASRAWTPHYHPCLRLTHSHHFLSRPPHGVAGAWEDVFAAPDTSASKGAAESGDESFSAVNSPPPPQQLRSTASPSAASGASRDVGALLLEARHLLRSSEASGGSAAADLAAAPVLPVTPPAEAEGGVATAVADAAQLHGLRVSATAAAPPWASPATSRANTHHYRSTQQPLQQDDGSPTGARRSASASQLRRRDSVGMGAGGSVASRRTGSGAAVVAASVTLNSDEVMPLPRKTASAAPALRNARGIASVLSSFPRRVQFAIRDFAMDYIELRARRDALRARVDSDPRVRAGDPPPKLLVQVEAEMAVRVKRLAALAGREGAALIIDAVSDSATVGGFGLDPIEREEDQGGDARTVAPHNPALTTARSGASVFGGGDGSDGVGDEANARVWRRRLDPRAVQPARSLRPGASATHESPNVRGVRDLHNDLNARDPEEGLSYYQKQQLRYGRARRGSTSVAGACERGATGLHAWWRQLLL